jgi:type II secretory pathway component HofQ
MDRLALALTAVLAASPALASSAAHAAPPHFTGQRVDIELQAAPLDGVLELFADIGHVNIVKQGDVRTGPITVYFRNVRWDEALYRIVRAHGLEMVVDGNVIYVRGEA